MDAYDRCTNLGKKILPIVLPSMVEAEKFADHPRSSDPFVTSVLGWVGLSAPWPSCFTHGKDLVPPVQKAAWTLGLVWVNRK